MSRYGFFMYIVLFEEKKVKNQLVLLIRIHMFLGLLDPDPLVRGTDP
jgi:hypothetical protein